MNPWSIQWAQNAFYPQQLQFMALLTCWLVFESIRKEEINNRYFTYATIALIVTYFCWEGSGFIIPAMGLAMIIVRWGKWDWIKNRHVWFCVFVTACIIV